MPFGHLYPPDPAPGSAGSVPPPRANRSGTGREFAAVHLTPAPGAGPGGDPSVGPPTCDALLREFLDLIRGIEVDFALRWDAARLSDRPGTHPQAAPPGWGQHV